MGNAINKIAWPVRPDEVEQCINSAIKNSAYPVHVDTVKQYGGRSVYGITVSKGKSEGKDGRRDTCPTDTRPTALLFTQPHAHEPATTVALLNILSELTTGKDLDGNITTLDVDAILTKFDITILPDGNPDGRNRAKWLDGKSLGKHWKEFAKQMRGTNTQTGEMWERFDKWNIDEVDPVPDPIGIVYEQLDKKTWCEPNRCEESSFMKMCYKLMAQRNYVAWLDLHQTFLVTDNPSPPDANCFALLPLVQNELPKEQAENNMALAKHIHRWWEDGENKLRMTGGTPVPLPPTGARPTDEPIVLSYTGEQAEYFRRVWGPIQQKLTKISVEVQMNADSTPPEVQVALEAQAVRAAIDWAMQSN